MHSKPLLTTRQTQQLHSLHLRQELLMEGILDWWLKYMPAPDGRLFYGAVDIHNQPVPNTEIGVVMVSRILWTFSSAYLSNPDPRYAEMADRAYRLIRNSFVDPRYGGVYWSLDSNGTPANLRKQIYGQAFCIYGCAAYYRIFPEPEVIDLAHELFALIERYSYDPVHEGYIEALAEDWTAIDDLRLSTKDANTRKTMNTHLHLVEAYAELYSVAPNIELNEKTTSLLELFANQWIDPVTGHLRLFMTDDWQVQHELISYGHDIEAAWLLPYCAGLLGNDELTARFESLVPLITDAALRGWDDADGGIWYEYEPAQKLLIREKHWWPQSEAQVGLIHAFERTHKNEYLEAALDLQHFIETQLLDRMEGEWFWGTDADGKLIPKEKGGFWKCPYHNTRAALQLTERIDRLLLQATY